MSDERSSFEQHMIEQQARETMSRVHNFVSTVGNALERISILIDEDEQDEAKREIAELREALSRINP